MSYLCGKKIEINNEKLQSLGLLSTIPPPKPTVLQGFDVQGVAVGLPDGGMTVSVPECMVHDGTAVGTAVGVSKVATFSVPECDVVDDMIDIESNVDNDHDGEDLSWYERLRESKIAWNKEKLRMLGLSTKEFSSNAELTNKKICPSGGSIKYAQAEGVLAGESE